MTAYAIRRHRASFCNEFLQWRTGNVRPLEGQIIAHGWEVTSVAPGEDGGAGVPIEFQVSVERPATEKHPESAVT